MSDQASSAPALDPTTIKAGVAWGGTGLSYALQWLGFGSWGDFAAFVASIYSLMLVGDWLYKKWKGIRNAAAHDARR